MKKIPMLFLLSLASQQVFGATSAITETGDTVILNDDGTWYYEQSQSTNNDEIESDKAIYTKSDNATFNLKSKVTNASFWLNPKDWSVSRTSYNDYSEYSFRVPNTDVYAMVISEGIEIKPEELIKIAYQNAKSAAPDAKIIKTEYRNVNGETVIHMIMRGTIQSIDFTYIGYYHSNASGSTQFLTYTGSNLIEKYEAQIYSLLNGFAIQE